MKTKISILSASGAILSIIACGMTTSMAQTIDTSKGTIMDSADTPSGEVKKSPGADKLVAHVNHADEDKEGGGEVTFTPAGDSVNVHGSVRGLEPNQAYHVSVDLPESPGAGMTTSAAPSNSGPPTAGAPVAGAPSAGTPQAGQPDGESRPGNSASGTSGSGVSGSSTSNSTPGQSGQPSASRAGNLGIVTTDSNGLLLINASLKNVDQTNDPGKIIGKSLSIRSTTGEAMTTVAGGIISIPDDQEKGTSEQEQLSESEDTDAE